MAGAEHGRKRDKVLVMWDLGEATSFWSLNDHLPFFSPELFVIARVNSGSNLQIWKST